MPERCPRCGLEPLALDADGCCPACRAVVIPQGGLEDGHGRRHRLSPGGTTIGRRHFEPDAKADTVSHRHVRIAFDGDRGVWFLIRVSDARTVVNGAECPLLGRMQLSDGAQIMLGAIQLTFRSGGG